MSELILKDEVYAIIGAAIEVHREQGFGFPEEVYQESLEEEFRDRAIGAISQPEFPVFYKGKKLRKTFRPDFVVFDKVVVELKALERLSPREESQLLGYLKATDFQVGVLINFGSYGKLEWKRMVSPKVLSASKPASEQSKNFSL
jgi:GxxExxY protein